MSPATSDVGWRGRPVSATRVDSPDSDLMSAGRSYPTPEEAHARVIAMETTNAAGTDAPILKPSSAGNVNDSYVAAALAVMRGLFLKQNGEVNYSSAARHYLGADARAGSGVRIKEWVRKLELLDQAEGQATLAGHVAELSIDETDVMHDVALDISLAILPDNSPPASVLPSPPCTATESVPDSTSEKGPDPWNRFSSASSARGRQSSSTSQRSTAYVPPHLRSVASTDLTSANLRSQEGGHARAQPEDDAISVATSAVSYNSTYHSRMRREQRSVSQREVQAALKHGWRDQIVDYRFGSGIRFKHEYQGVIVITAQDLQTIISVWTSPLWMQVHNRLMKVLDAPDGSYRGDSLPASATEFTEDEAMAFMRVADQGCKQLGFPDVPTLLIDFGCGCLEQALQLSALAEPCWTPEQLASVLARVSEQAAPHPRILALLSLAVAGGTCPAPFPWKRRWQLNLEELSEAIDVCGGSVAACGTDMVNRNLLHLFSHFQNEAAVQLLMARGCADLINSPNVHGRMPIFSAAGTSAPDCVKATRLTRLLCEARCSVDWVDVNGRNILHHAIKRPLGSKHDPGHTSDTLRLARAESRLEIVHLLVSQGANAHERDRRGTSPAALAFMDGSPQVADYLNGKPVCMASVMVITGGVQLRLQVLPTVPSAKFTPLRANLSGRSPHMQWGP